MFRNALWIVVFTCLGYSTSVHGQGPNVVLICVDDLRPELNCFGKDYIHSPNIDALAERGMRFRRHFVQAPTCGASRYAMLTGLYGPAGNHALFDRAKRLDRDAVDVPPSMPKWFRNNGYTTVSVGKVSHHPGGRGGPDWDDSAIPEMPGDWDRHLLPAGPWQHPRGAMHGLANGEIRKNAKNMDLFQSTEGDDSIYPDGLIVEESLSQLDRLAASSDTKPFFLAVGIIRPHLPFGAPAKYMQHYRDAELPTTPHPEKPAGKTTWHGSGEFMKYNRWGKTPNTDHEFALEVRRHYAACVSYADAQVGRVTQRLAKHGLTENTIIVLWGDHGWHLGEHAIWGKHALFEESLHSPMIISYPGMPQAGKSTDAMVETLDLFPTLCDLANLPAPEYVDGQSLQPILESPNETGHPAVAYTSKAKTIRTDKYRLIVHRGGETELYNHESPDGETSNIAAANQTIVSTLKKQLNARLQVAK
ncbi:sulfatase [Planctomycetes bacterium K23_9]|uniref:Arylsulfatase n=1 Tax=Stieleria marina TaxID=1930275 RepID=A0A517P157_9BACT|nr:Arylsulfatase [Planctomycetes bacterium K23_9]